MKVLLQITFFLSGSWLIYNSSTERYSLQFREWGKENYSERKMKSEILPNNVGLLQHEFRWEHYSNAGWLFCTPAPPKFTKKLAVDSFFNFGS